MPCLRPLGLLLLSLLAPGLSGCIPALFDLNQDFNAADAPRAAPGAPFTQTYARGGPEVRYASLGHFAGLLYGGRAVTYFRANQAFYAGPILYGSMPIVGNAWSPVFGYMGLQAGRESKVGPVLIDTGVLAGVTTRLSDCNESDIGQQILVEPSVAVGMRVPGMAGWQAWLVGGLLVLPLQFGQSGWCVSLRLDQKTLTGSVPAAD